MKKKTKHQNQRKYYLIKTDLGNTPAISLKFEHRYESKEICS